MKSAIAKDLGYDESPNFVDAAELESRPFLGHSHVYRKAREKCGLQGVYLLNAPGRPDEVPVVFYCQADNEDAARNIHRHVWNQGIVPFILVETPQAMRLYSGFRCRPKATSEIERGVLEASVAFNEVAERLDAFRAEAIDTGMVWNRWAYKVDPRSRVDWSLLAELEALGIELRRHRMDREHAHALIGKFVYLKYLCDRGILSDRKLAKWDLAASDIFCQTPTLKNFWKVNAQLDDWLNGSIFPLPRDAIRAEHLQLVANVFTGGTAHGQMSLDLGIYDFAFIPIETLSVIYQQFLHAPEESRTSRGREKGAYYTPLPLVNYMLGELESRRPLEEGMRVFDPSCGSGAFLVQCYRMLVEKRLRQGPVRPKELRDLLTKHIFGVDRDGDACQVAEMSLILTLLDYTSPPDLEDPQQSIKLPTLQDKNIFQADYFQEGTKWVSKRLHFKADWLVGNPPWLEVNKKKTEEPALKWMEENAEQFPTGGNQAAEAFVWHSIPLLNKGGVAGLLLPAMTLFKKESTAFRARLFTTVKTWCVANFSNLAYVLFAGRSQIPAMALFFEPRESSGATISPEERILTFAPFLANQRSGRAEHAAHRKDTWNIVVNGSEMRELRTSSVADGSFLPWKEAMWGSFRDGRLLRRIAKRFPSLRDFAKRQSLLIHEGFQLRNEHCAERVEPMPELTEQMQVDFSKLKECGRIFSFPECAFSIIPAAKAYVRQGRGNLPLSVSRPPHIVIAASRQFAVYSDEFLAIPARQIGIAGPAGTQCLLKAMSLILGSRFCTYHQFFSTSQWGIGFSRANLDVLRELPIPLDEVSDKQLHALATMRDDLAAKYVGCPPPAAVLREIDERVYDLYGLSRVERTLIDDFIHWDMQKVHGKVPADIVKSPPKDSISAYLGMLKDELDAFVGDDSEVSHDVRAVRGRDSAMIVLCAVNGAAPRPAVLESGERTAAALDRTREHLLRQHNQWLYFERCLKVYQDGAMYVLKPLEAIHWTRRQAILDAGEIIAETLGTRDE